MNRLILIGNGFDLAHDLKTSYKDFIEYLWRRIHDQLYKQVKLNYSNHQSKNIRFIDQDKLLIISITKISEWEGGTAYSLNASPLVGVILLEESIFQDDIPAFILDIKELECIYENSFFEKISTSYLDKNWSDIEADYYAELKESIDGSDKTSNKKNVQKLNEDFSQIKELLAGYLSQLKKHLPIPEIKAYIYSPINMQHVKLRSLGVICNHVNAIIPTLGRSSKEAITNYLSNKGINQYVAKDKLTPENILKKSVFMEGDSILITPESILMLNLNYTNTVSQYQSLQVLNNFSGNPTPVEAVQIHGTLASPEEMIFGYGDEEDEKYKKLEMSEIRGLLDNVKSINYLKSPNYRNLERFIESGPYQIFIMGMSCGLSDRTLLRKLFQHENCISIVPFYYQYMCKEGGKEVRKDNFNELSQNISRCFSNKDLLRSLVVDKTNCKPLVSISEKQ
ncbi:MAG: hypothetical protein H6Q14_2843 [Bacteroidetes bacterium]|nr:hypothetical protein [Bacteroidota bacterium]